LDHTACLRLDLFLLESKIETVREEMKRALDEGKFSAVFRLTRLLEFLNKRYEILLRGALDPNVQDAGWGAQRVFDPPRVGYCCRDPNGLPPDDTTCQRSDQKQCEEDSEGNRTNGKWSATQDECVNNGCSENPRLPKDQVICPFNSDYLPPGLPNASGKAYGCDDTAIAAALAKFPSSPAGDDPNWIDYNAPRETAQAELTAVQTMSGQVQRYIQDARKFLELQVEIDKLLERQTQFGQSPPAREHAKRQGCVQPNQEPWPEGAVRFDLRGPFSPSPEKNDTKILNLFRELRRYQGSVREIPEYLLSFWKIFFGEKVLKNYGQWFFGTYSTKQGEREANAFAVGSDPRLQIDKALEPFSKQMVRLATLAHEMSGGLRGFVRDYAFFLRRTCLQRPCNERLERVLKIVFQDACFPYTNGDFTGDGEGDSARWKKCAKAACVVLPGMQESDLPESCKKQLQMEKQVQGSSASSASS
jgi:hypothetical protein